MEGLHLSCYVSSKRCSQGVILDVSYTTVIFPAVGGYAGSIQIHQSTDIKEK